MTEGFEGRRFVVTSGGCGIGRACARQLLDAGADVLLVDIDEDALTRAYNGLQPVGRLGTPEDVAWGVVYLASDESKFVTDSELIIDGSYTVR